MKLNRKTLRKMILHEIKRSLKETINPAAVSLVSAIKSAIYEAEYVPVDVGADSGSDYIIGVGMPGSPNEDTAKFEHFPNNPEANAVHMKIAKQDPQIFKDANVRSHIEEENGLYTIHYVIKEEQDEGYVPDMINP